MLPQHALVMREQNELRRVLGVQPARRLDGRALAVVPGAAVALVPRRQGACTRGGSKQCGSFVRRRRRRRRQVATAGQGMGLRRFQCAACIALRLPEAPQAKPRSARPRPSTARLAETMLAVLRCSAESGPIGSVRDC